MLAVVVVVVGVIGWFGYLVGLFGGFGVAWLLCEGCYFPRCTDGRLVTVGGWFNG